MHTVTKRRCLKVGSRCTDRGCALGGYHGPVLVRIIATARMIIAHVSPTSAARQPLKSSSGSFGSKAVAAAWADGRHIGRLSQCNVRFGEGRRYELTIETLAYAAPFSASFSANAAMRCLKPA